MQTHVALPIEGIISFGVYIALFSSGNCNEIYIYTYISLPPTSTATTESLLARLPSMLILEGFPRYN